jgi:hypothetical protein
MDENICIWGLVITLRLLRSHLFTSTYLKLPESETGLTIQIRDKLYATLNRMLQRTPETEIDKKIMKEASLTLIHSLEVFFTNQNEKLDKLIESMNMMNSDQSAENDTQLNILTQFFQKMTIPIHFSQTFDQENPEAQDKLTEVFNIALDIAFECSKEIIEEKQSSKMIVIQFLESA